MSAPPGTETREPLCDFCDERKALVYCRADDARLCLSCDLQVHAANAVSSRHPRSLLCDVCLAAPSSILCSTHRSLLCHNCDFDAHERDAEIVGVAHQRRPVEPYSGCPVASELPGVLGIGEDEKCLGLDGNGSGEFGEGTDWCLDETGESLLLWEAPPVMSLDDLIVPTSARHRFQAVGVPPPPKDRNMSCGKHKDEIIRQLRSMVESGPDLNQFSNHEQCISFQHVVAHNEFKSEEEYDTFWESETAVESCYEGELQSLNHFDCQDMAADTSIFLPSHLAQTPQEENFVLSHGVSNSQNHQNMDDVSDAEPEHHNTVTSVSPGVILTMTGAERDSAISRYREKRKTRRYDKHVRYESRKARAETRVRVKGRFAKIVTRDTKK